MLKKIEARVNKMFFLLKKAYMLKRPKVMLGTYCQFFDQNLLIEAFLKTILKKIFALLERNFS